MKLIIASCIVLVGCGPAFTEAVDGPIATTDGAVDLETDAIDGGSAGPEASTVEHAPEIEAGIIGKSDADPPPPVDASAGLLEHDASPDVAVVDPPDVHAVPPRCDTVIGIVACDSWASTYCGAAGEAMCCRADGVCGCKVTMGATCQ